MGLGLGLGRAEGGGRGDGVYMSTKAVKFLSLVAHSHKKKRDATATFLLWRKCTFPAARVELQPLKITIGGPFPQKRKWQLQHFVCVCSEVHVSGCKRRTAAVRNYHWRPTATKKERVATATLLCDEVHVSGCKHRYAAASVCFFSRRQLSFCRCRNGRQFSVQRQTHSTVQR